MFDQLSDNARRAVGQATQWAVKQEHDCVDAVHVALGLIERSNGATRYLASRRVDVESLDARLRTLLAKPSPAATTEPSFTSAARQILESASRKARELGHPEVHTGHLLLAVVLQSTHDLLALLVSSGLDFRDLAQSVASSWQSDTASPSVSFKPLDLGVVTVDAVTVSLHLDFEDLVVRFTDRNGRPAEVICQDALAFSWEREPPVPETGESECSMSIHSPWLSEEATVAARSPRGYGHYRFRFGARGDLEVIAKIPVLAFTR